MDIPYITFRELNKGKLEYYILQKAFPHYLCRVSTNPYEEVFFKSEIPGYNMVVILVGTLRGDMVIPGYKDVNEEILAVMSNMAAWFWAERIQENHKKFEKFKIKNNAASPIK